MKKNDRTSDVVARQKQKDIHTDGVEKFGTDGVEELRGKIGVSGGQQLGATHVVGQKQKDIHTDGVDELRGKAGITGGQQLGATSHVVGLTGDDQLHDCDMEPNRNEAKAGIGRAEVVVYKHKKFLVPVVVKNSEIQFASPNLEKFRQVKLDNKPMYDLIEEEDIFLDFEEDEVRDITSQKDQLWSQDIDIPSTQILFQNKIERKTIEKQEINTWDLHLNHLDDDFVDREDKVAPSRTKARSNSFKTSPPLKKQKPRTIWFPTNQTFTISEEIFKYVYDADTAKFDKLKFHYRKDSIAIELDILFPGCVLYLVREPYMGKKEVVIQAYCAHTDCRKVKLCATRDNVRTYRVYVNRIDPVHKEPMTRQLRRYEKVQKQIELTKKSATEVRNDDIAQSDKELVKLGSYDKVKSARVYINARHKALKAQDDEEDDYEDLVKMLDTTDYISHLLHKGKFGVYIHNKSQHAVLHKLHLKREKDKVPIICRLDATGNLARALRDVIGQLLYYALTINVTIKQDHSSSALPLTEQFNIGHTSKDIAMWLFQFVLTHYEYYDNAPLLIDFIIIDFSYASMHAILFAFNGTTLSKYLNTTFEWIKLKLMNGEFPEAYNFFTKVRMCLTHLMHTFAEMCKRHYGQTPQRKQVKESKIVLEILGAMIKADNYSNVLKLWKQLSILLSNEFENDHVLNAISEVASIIEDEVDLDDYAEEQLQFAVDVDNLPENQHTTLYASNLFYLEFVRIKNEKNYVYGNVKTQKNPYYNPKFLDKFLTRFVPLIPMWTSVLVKDIKEFPLPDIAVLQVGNNQPIEGYFGFLKRTISARQISLGKPPIKIGRAIKTSRELISPLIDSINYTIPKEYLNKKPSSQSSNGSSQSSKASHSDEICSQTSKPSSQSSNRSTGSKSTKAPHNDHFLDDVFENNQFADEICSQTSKPSSQSSNRSTGSKSTKAPHNDHFLDDVFENDQFADEISSQTSKPSSQSSNRSTGSKSTKVPHNDHFLDDVFENNQFADEICSQTSKPSSQSSNRSTGSKSTKVQHNDHFLDDVFENNQFADEISSQTSNPSSQSSNRSTGSKSTKAPHELVDDVLPAANAVLNSNVVVTRSKSRIKVSDCVADTSDTVGDTKKDIDNDPSRFVNAKESFKKKQRVPFTYLQHYRISKAGKAAKVVKQKENAVAVYRSNGLFKDTRLYSDLNFDFVVASKNEMFLHNHEFDALRSAEISPILMKYLLETIRYDNIQIELENTMHIVEKPKVTVQLNKKTILLLLLKDEKWILFILNKDKQTFATLDPSIKSEKNFFSTFLKFVKIHNAKFKITNEEQWKEVSFEYDILNALNSSDSGMYVYHYIMQYINTGTVVKSNFSPQNLRDQLRNKLLQFSDDMRESCLKCGIADDDRMVECTKCLRWLHGYCIGLDVSKISLEDIIHCPMCMN